MGVVFELVGKLVVKNKGEISDINTARGDVGGDEKLDALFFKGTHHFITFLLSEVALEDFYFKAFFSELIAEGDRAGLGSAKDETPLVALFFQKIDDELVLLGMFEDGVSVVDVAIDHVLVLHLEEGRLVGKVVLDEVFHLVREGGGEEPGALAFGGELEDFGELGLEAHAEHFVGFVEDEKTNGGDIESLAFEEVKETSRSGDYDLGGSSEGGNLAVNRVTASEDFGKDLGRVFRETKELFADLFGELAGGGEDQTLDASLSGIDFGEKGESEGGGLSRAGLGLGNEVTAILLQAGNGVVLNLGGLVNAEFFETFDKVFRDTESKKGIGHNEGKAIRNFGAKSEIFREARLLFGGSMR